MKLVQISGDYDVIVKFDNQSVPGSPFKPKILQNEPAVEVGSPSDICMSPEGISAKGAWNDRTLFLIVFNLKKVLWISRKFGCLFYYNMVVSF